MAWPAGTMRGPSTHPMSMAFIRATSRSRPPVCTKSPRLRTVVKPARRVRRALAAPRSVLMAGSSWTGMSGLAWLGPPMTRFTSMSISPGSRVTSPRSTRRGVGGDRGGGDPGDAIASSTSRLARLDQLLAGARRACGHSPGGRAAAGCGVGPCRLLRGPVASVATVLSKFPESATAVTVAKPVVGDVTSPGDVGGLGLAPSRGGELVIGRADGSQCAARIASAGAVSASARARRAAVRDRASTTCARRHGFHPLRVKRVVDETADTRSFVLDVPPELAATFNYRPGQFCTFRVRLGADEHFRCYSMSSAPDTDADLAVTVKRVPGERSPTGSTTPSR